MDMITQMLMNRLKAQNPRGYQMISQAMQNNGDPQPMLKQMFSNASPEQRQNILTQAQQLGMPSEILARLQNMR
jgi:hypothetical protein